MKIYHKIKSTIIACLPVKTIKSTASGEQHDSLHSRKNVPQAFNRGLLLLFLLFCGLSTLLIRVNAMHGRQLQEGIADEIIRFHVIANSDSTEDQNLKLTIKNTLVEKLAPLLETASSITEARTVLSENLTLIRDIAEEEIRRNGYVYPVTVSLEEVYFPMKIYGDYTFPPGIYEALRVQIGEAQGKNWWCVMFPPLCFVDETYSIVDEDSDERLKYLLSEEEYEALKSKKTPVKVRFRLFEAIKKLFR